MEHVEDVDRRTTFCEGEVDDQEHGLRRYEIKCECEKPLCPGAGGSEESVCILGMETDEEHPRCSELVSIEGISTHMYSRYGVYLVIMNNRLEMREHHGDLDEQLVYIRFKVDTLTTKLAPVPPGTKLGVRRR